MAVSHGFNLTEATTSVSAPVQVSSGLQIIVGTAPVNQLANPAAAVNTPLYVSTYKEAVAAVGWSSDFAKYTLCEAISANFQVVGTAPIVVINVLDPANKKHITALDETSVQVNDGVAEIDKVGILLEKLVVKKDDTTLTADVDYIASFNDDGTVSLALINGGAGDGATTLTVSGSILDASKVTADDIVGGVNAATGAETGLEVVRQVYPKLSKAPGILLAPRFSKNAQVCAALQAKCRKIDGLFNAVCFIDLDCSADGAQKYTDVAEQKDEADGDLPRGIRPVAVRQGWRNRVQRQFHGGSGDRVQRQSERRPPRCKPFQCHNSHLCRLSGRRHGSADGSGTGHLPERLGHCNLHPLRHRLCNLGQ